MKNREWVKDAACRGMGPQFFFPEIGDAHTVKGALEICNGNRQQAPCPVREQCLQYALTFSDDDDRYGVFGGLVPHRRSEMRKERRRNEAAAEATRNSELKLLLDLVHEAFTEHENRRVAEKAEKRRRTLELRKQD